MRRRPKSGPHLNWGFSHSFLGESVRRGKERGFHGHVTHTTRTLGGRLLVARLKLDPASDLPYPRITFPISPAAVHDCVPGRARLLSTISKLAVSPNVGLRAHFPALPQPCGYTEEKGCYLECSSGKCWCKEVLCLCNQLVEQRHSELGRF